MVQSVCRVSFAFFLVAGSSLLAQRPPEPDLTITAADRREVIDNSISILHEFYVFPQVAAEMEEALRARDARGEYDSITSAREFAETLTQHLREVSGDQHLRVSHQKEEVRDRPFDEAPSAEYLERQRALWATYNHGFEKVERLRGNIAYINLRSFIPADVAAETGAAAMTLVSTADALIIDLRQNRGGDPDMVAFLGSYLFDERVHVNDIQERYSNSTEQFWTSAYVPGRRFGGTKPVYLLTSSRTFSAGESFAYFLKTAGRATLIGETTAGGAHPVTPAKVAAHFQLNVPYARSISPVTGTNWEGTGVTPDIGTSADAAMQTAYLLALERLMEASPDAGRRQELQRVLDEVAPR